MAVARRCCWRFSQPEVAAPIVTQMNTMPAADLFTNVELPEDRAMSLRQLRYLRELIESDCREQIWTDPFPTIGASPNQDFGKALNPNEVNLYHLNYHLILPQSVPQGVELFFPPQTDKSKFRVGQSITQINNPPPHVGMAIGQIHSVQAVSKGTKVTVRMLKGCFTSQKQQGNQCFGENLITVGDHVHDRPERVESLVNCSYMESVSLEAQSAQTFCSHFWGESVFEFIQCCEEHSKLREFDPDFATYWVCAYANRQHDLGADIDPNPDNTSFRRAMGRASGTLLILDAFATPFRRIWCDYEIYTTLSCEGKFLDIASVQSGRAHFLADGVPQESGERGYLKIRREGDFPVRLLGEGMNRRLEEGQASQEIDKVRILNRMRGGAVLDDTCILEQLQRGYNSEFDDVNRALHALFAVAAWPQAVQKGLLHDFDGTDKLNLPSLLKADTRRKSLDLNFSHFGDTMTDEQVTCIAEHLPPHLTDLVLIFFKCNLVSDISAKSLGDHLPVDLSSLQLDFFRCERLTDVGVSALTQALPRTLMNLELNFACCRLLTDASVIAISEHLLLDLISLRLCFRLCGGKITNVGLEALGKELPKSLVTLQLDFRMCDISDDGLLSLGARLPGSLRNFDMCFGRCKRVTKAGFEVIQARFPEASVDNTYRIRSGSCECGKTHFGLS